MESLVSASEVVAHEVAMKSLIPAVEAMVPEEEALGNEVDVVPTIEAEILVLEANVGPGIEGPSPRRARLPRLR